MRQRCCVGPGGGPEALHAAAAAHRAAGRARGCSALSQCGLRGLARGGIWRHLSPPTSCPRLALCQPEAAAPFLNVGFVSALAAAPAAAEPEPAEACSLPKKGGRARSHNVRVAASAAAEAADKPWCRRLPERSGWALFTRGGSRGCVERQR